MARLAVGATGTAGGTLIAGRIARECASFGGILTLGELGEPEAVRVRHFVIIKELIYYKVVNYILND